MVDLRPVHSQDAERMELRREVEHHLATIQDLLGVIEGLRESLRQSEADNTRLAAQLAEAATFSTRCAACGEVKHCPVRIDEDEGYVCAGCLLKQRNSARAKALDDAEEDAASAKARASAAERALRRRRFLRWFSFPWRNP